jgi:hypothetical protein
MVINCPELPSESFNFKWSKVGDVYSPSVEKLSKQIDLSAVKNYVPENNKADPVVVKSAFFSEWYGTPSSKTTGGSSIIYFNYYPKDICTTRLYDSKNQELDLESSSFDRIFGFGYARFFGDKKEEIKFVVNCQKSGILNIEGSHIGAKPIPEVQEKVRFGIACYPPGGKGKTADGRDAICALSNKDTFTKWIPA